MFPQETMDLSLKSEGINLEFLELLTSQVKRTSGVLALDMQVSGTPDRPEHKGWIRLTDGDFYLVPLGQRFGKIQAYVTFSEDRVALESFRVGDKKERLSASGQVLLDRFEVREFDLSVKARELEAVNWPELKATLQADLRLTGDLKAPRLDGNAELTRAVVQLYSFVESPSDSFWTTSEFWKNLDGRVRVSTPRNVWIRDRDINVELEGDIDLVKDRQGLRIYGSLNSRQGRYEFLNTTFRIERAEIQFLGNVDINPDLYVLGTHPLRLISRQAGEPGEEAVISVIVGGSLLKPQVTLESDPFLSEADILSYLTIGRPAGGAIGGEGGGFGLEGQAAGLVMGVAASQLKRTIGAQLNLDVVEVDMGEGASLTRVRVGKYIGSRLFITYSQELSSAGGQEVTVEYELLPHVTLEAQQRVGSEQQRDRQSLGIFWKKDW